ncbi:hypothetical protein M2282_006080 [Variovorax boronicumulans]|nr:hypothetical protein [Variovorax boronicumulans]
MSRAMLCFVFHRELENMLGATNSALVPNEMPGNGLGMSRQTCTRWPNCSGKF